VTNFAMKNIAIIGATGGIGQAFVEHFAASEKIECIYACSRSHHEYNDSRIISIDLDLEQPDSIEAAAAQIDARSLDIIIAATGILHAEGYNPLQPEKSLRDVNAEQLQRVLAINTIGPALLLRHFLPLLKKDSRAVFALLSARVGSISDNRLGGWYSYRASKAALNMLIKTASIETRRTNKQAIIVGLHPGTVDSQLSKPFQARVPEHKLFTAAQSAAYMADVLESVDIEDTGKCFAWDGKEVPA
jgi:NAD(P)-dependent dehydrogenase (short-subunit alcohol dehydrogenase family)